jgi:hypothetical protein
LEDETPAKPLGELCDLEHGISCGIVKVGDSAAGGVPFIRDGDIRNGRIIVNNAKRVPDKISRQVQRTILKGGEILISLRAEPGHTAIGSPALIGANAPVRAKAEGRDPGLPPHLADLFPDSVEDSEVGEILRGWGVARLDDIACF